MVRLLARFLVIAAAVWIVAAVVPGVVVREGVENYLVTRVGDNVLGPKKD